MSELAVKTALFKNDSKLQLSFPCQRIITNNKESLTKSGDLLHAIKTPANSTMTKQLPLQGSLISLGNS